jgi:hypothetical protein
MSDDAPLIEPPESAAPVCDPVTAPTAIAGDPPKGIGGAPKGNGNARRHGLRGRNLLPEEKYIENAARAFQHSTEDAVIVRFGEVGLYHAAVIQSAVRHEIRAKLIGRWLNVAKEQGEKLSLLDQANLLKQLSDASDSRDRCLEKLGLNDRDDIRGKPAADVSIVVLPSNRREVTNA